MKCTLFTITGSALICFASCMLMLLVLGPSEKRVLCAIDGKPCAQKGECANCQQCTEANDRCCCLHNDKCTCVEVSPDGTLIQCCEQ